jgi:type III restriction enzyme
MTGPQLVRRLRQASRGVRDGDLEAVSLSAPTGSGKTVIATAAIELILQGDGQAAPQPDATFLWITDHVGDHE